MNARLRRITDVISLSQCEVVKENQRRLISVDSNHNTFRYTKRTSRRAKNRDETRPSRIVLPPAQNNPQTHTIKGKSTGMSHPFHLIPRPWRYPRPDSLARCLCSVCYVGSKINVGKLSDGASLSFNMLAAGWTERGVGVGGHNRCLTAVFGALAAVGTTFASFFAHEAAAEGG